mmetsp:Transcript_22783/g.65678  ORF Transcript_22783/g.65678 Transcript_22783/m.65678 type:complete len:223 (+) Transcript_22783:122-790(+)
MMSSCLALASSSRANLSNNLWASMASFHCFRSASSFRASSSARCLSSSRARSMRACSSSAALASSAMTDLMASSTLEWPRALVRALRAERATSRMSSKATFSATFFNSGTRRGPKGATASGVSTRRLIFSMTTQQLRLLRACFSFSPRERMGHRMDSVDASTGETKVVALSSSTAFMVSVGLTMALRMAGMAGLMSGLTLVWQQARMDAEAARVTCGLVSQT